MEDERRKFLQGLLAMGGGAAILPELVEAAQTNVKLEKPLSAKLLKKEIVKNEPFTDSHFEMEIVGANGVKQIVTSHNTEYKDAATRRTSMLMQVDTFENAGAEKPAGSDVIAMHGVSRKIDSSTDEVTLVTAMNGKIYTNTMKAQVPAAGALMSAEGLTDEELIEKFFLSKVRGGKP